MMTSAPPTLCQANAEKVVTAGWVSNGSDNDFFIARYNVSNLGLDTSFDGDGMLSTTFGSGNGDVAYGVAIQPDGRIIAAGSTTTPGSGGATDFAIARYKLPAGLDQRHFAQHDANFNITSITDANGQVAERYLYTAHGEVTALDGAWYSLSGTQFGMRYFFQGGRYQADAATYNFRNRDYSPAMGRWMSQDEAYYDGANLYEAMRSNPTMCVDPMGLAATTKPSTTTRYEPWYRKFYPCKSTFYMSMWLQEEDLTGFDNIEKFSLWIQAENVDGKIKVLDSWAGHEQIDTMGGGYGHFDATPHFGVVSYIGDRAEVYWQFEAVENPSWLIGIGAGALVEGVGIGAGAALGSVVPILGTAVGAEVGGVLGAAGGAAVAAVVAGDFGGKGAYTVHVTPKFGGVEFSISGNRPTTFGDDELRWNDLDDGDSQVGVLDKPIHYINGKSKR